MRPDEWKVIEQALGNARGVSSQLRAADEPFSPDSLDFVASQIDEWISTRLEALLSTPDPGGDRVEVVAGWLVDQFGDAWPSLKGSPDQQARDLLRLLDPAPTDRPIGCCGGCGKVAFVKPHIARFHCPDCIRGRVERDPAPTDQGAQLKSQQSGSEERTADFLAEYPDQGAEGSGGRRWTIEVCDTEGCSNRWRYCFATNGCCIMCHRKGIEVDVIPAPDTETTEGPPTDEGSDHE